MILLIIDLLQKFDYRINETNIKQFLKALQKIDIKDYFKEFLK